jgi:hypothetical protein
MIHGMDIRANLRLISCGYPRASLLLLGGGVVTFRRNDRGRVEEELYDAHAPIFISFPELQAALTPRGSTYGASSNPRDVTEP